MKHGLGVLALVLVGAAHAAEPAAPALPAATRAAPPAADAAAAKSPGTVARAKPLDLRIGHFRNYMMPKDYLAAIDRPDADKNTVVVEGKRELLPMEQIENVPPGLAGLWYGARHPLNAWRLLAPVVNAPDTGKPSPVPPPVFRWGP